MLAVGSMAFGGISLVGGGASDAANRFWAIGFLLGGAGLLLLLLRSTIPDSLSIHLGNSVILSGLGCLLHALTVHTGKSRFTPVTVVWWLISVGVFNVAASPIVGAAVDVRVLIMSAAVITSQILALQILGLPFRHPDRVHRFLWATHAILGLAFSFRFLFILLAEFEIQAAEPYPYFFEHVIDALFFLIVIFLPFTQAPAFLLLRKQRADRETGIARQRLAQVEASGRVERRLQAERLQMARETAIEHFARGLAHDANNILGTLQLAHGELRSRVKRGLKIEMATLKFMGSALGHAQATTSGLMAMASNQPSPLERVCVDKMVKEVAAAIEFMLPENIRLEIASETGLVVRSHQGFLRSALFNLALNARDAMPTGGVIRIGAFRRAQSPTGSRRIGMNLRGPVVDIAITDEGGGISDELLKQLFAPGFSGREGGENRGYGLYIVERVVTRTDAELVVDTAADRGTEMHLLMREELS